jgi:arsenate reductase
MTSALHPSLQQQFQLFEKEFALIPESRKKILEELGRFIEEKHRHHQKADLNFICTHNSRRSHISQIWAHAAAFYYEVSDVRCYSGGTEATAFNPRLVKAVSDVGFKLVKASDSENPRYAVSIGEDLPTIMAFSKVYSDRFNPSRGFAAIMTCSHADENCPVVTGAEKRISLPFNDPKEFDGTPLETQKYAERVHEIGREIAYAFYELKRRATGSL